MYGTYRMTWTTEHTHQQLSEDVHAEDLHVFTKHEFVYFILSPRLKSHISECFIECLNRLFVQ